MASTQIAVHICTPHDWAYGGQRCECRVPTSPNPSGHLHFGVPRGTTHEQRASAPRSSHHFHPQRKAGSIVDLAVDKELPLSAAYSDENGNPVPAPASAVESFTSDNAEVVAIATADDGVLVARATGLPGTQAIINGSATWTDEDGRSFSITFAPALLSLVVGGAERATLVFGAPREITPDEPANPPAEPGGEEPPAEDTPSA